MESPQVRIKLPNGRSVRISYDVSLDKFDADDENADVPGTPRSLEAMNRMGVAYEEILMKRLSDFKGPGKDNNYASMELQAYDRLRRDTIDQLIQTRMVIIEEQFADARGDDLAMREAEAQRKRQEMMERERKRVEFVAERQQKQLSQKMQFEMMQARTEGEALSKVARAEAKAQLREEENKRKQEDYALDRARRAEERAQKDESDRLFREQEQKMKAALLEEKERVREIAAMEKKERHKAATAAKQEKQKRKIGAARQVQARQLAEQADKMEKKFELTELRREQVEAEREMQQQQRTVEAERKQEEIKAIKQRVFKVEVARKAQLLTKQKAAEARLEQRQLMQARLDREQKLQDAEKERERRETRYRIDDHFAKSIDEMRKRGDEKEVVVEKSKELKKIEVKKHVMHNSLKRQMKMDKVERAKRATEYQRQMLEDKIKQEQIRQNQIKAYKEQVNEERKEMQRQALLKAVEMEKKVAEAKRKMAKKSTKMQMSGGMSEEIPESTTSRPGSSSGTLPLTAKKRRSVSRAKSPDAGTSSGQRGDYEERPKSVELPPAGTSERGTAAPRSPVGQNDQKGSLSSEHKALLAEDQIQAMWRGQNERLLRCLEEEEVREAEREAQLRAVEYELTERQRLEKQFEGERATARERIVKMTQHHERTLLNQMQTLGLIGKDGMGQSMVMV